MKLDDGIIKKFKVTQLSRDHSPNWPDERQRILRTGNGSVMKLKDKHGKPTGPYRVFNKYGLEGGLAMSRSIGDRSLTEAGVISTPEFIEYDITQNDQVLIIASDGVWEFLSNEDIIQLTQTVSNP